jgi:hypothetical protein
MTRLLAALAVTLALPAAAGTCPDACALRLAFDPAVIAVPGPGVTPEEIAAALALIGG